jgi:molybdopterin-guanine dinucleotide biosynthesis protein A
VTTTSEIGPPISVASSVASAVDGLLVAGGRSRRFGADKRRAVIAGATLAERALALLRGAAGGDLFVAGDGAFDHPVDAIFLRDAAANAGPLGGILAALARSRFGVLVLPCDAPFVRADTLATLARLGLRRGTTVCVRSPRGVEPLVAFYPRSALPILAGGLREGTKALHRLIPRLGASFVVASDARELHNVNRPGDYELARTWSGT